MFLRLLASCALLCVAAIAQDERSPTEVRVLLVGHDPANRHIPFADMAEPRTFQLYRERTAAWEALLRYHFADVRVVHGKDYTASMSDDVDVTVFDALPKALAEAKRERDPATGKMNYEPASYLPESFDRPAVTISMNSARIGEPLGLKLDWL